MRHAIPLGAACVLALVCQIAASSEYVQLPLSQSPSAPSSGAAFAIHHGATARDRMQYAARGDLIDASDDRDALVEPFASLVHRTQRAPVAITEHEFEFVDKLSRRMYIDWVGNSSVIIVMAWDSANSTLFRSDDYGATFVSEVDKLLPDANLDMFYINAVYDRIILVDNMHNVMYTSLDAGATYTHHAVTFNATTIEYHPTVADYVLAWALDGSLHLTTDFGSTWTQIGTHVRSFSWGVVEVQRFGKMVHYDTPQTIFMEERQLNSNSYCARKSLDLGQTFVDILCDTIAFNVLENYEFITSSTGLKVSHNRGDYNDAVFPIPERIKHYFVADATENQAFVAADYLDVTKDVGGHVLYANGTRTLFISESEGVDYSVSLERVVYIPMGETGLDILDLVPVSGMSGVYVANSVVSWTSSRLRSSISFDKGGTWLPIRAPTLDSDNQYIDCMLPACSLHLHSAFSYRTGVNFPIMSAGSSVGLIVGMGNLGDVLTVAGDVYMSRDGGITWSQELKGRHRIRFADHGGLIAAVDDTQATNVLKYTFDEGETWHEYTFHPTPIMVRGLFTEPGETTTVFTLMGFSPTANSHWIVEQVDLRSVLQRPCTPNDYQLWTPSDERVVGGDDRCMLGRQTTYERRISSAVCFNGNEYDRPVSQSVCQCSVEDFECDIGYTREQPSEPCVVDPYVNQTALQLLMYEPCLTKSSSHYMQTRGYRRVSGDTCVGGLNDQLAHISTPCPAAIYVVNQTVVVRNVTQVVYEPSSGVNGHLIAVFTVVGLIALASAVLAAVHFRKRYKALRVKYARLSIQSGDLAANEADDDIDFDPESSQPELQVMGALSFDDGNLSAGPTARSALSSGSSSRSKRTPRTVRFDDVLNDADDDALRLDDITLSSSST